ncbi:MAG: AAA family ATPase [Planctomycetales bacterium]|nr:AAA family ATPase [Planctomycetales bacterium]
MYEELFHSPNRPFRATPDARFYFPHESIETTRQTVVRAMQRAEGPVMVLGGAGLGKSLLGMLISDDLSARFDTVQLAAARLCSRRALLQNILFELQMPYRDLSEGELRLSILDRLLPASQHAPDGVLIVVDEAHTLPAKLLDELRLITNFTRDHQPRARLVLIGSLRLEDTFAEPQMESFNQRLAARCYLQPMNRQQTREYVLHQLTVAGVNAREYMTEEALASVYAASEGVPRLANQLMDHTLVLAITRGQSPVSAALIEEAWADLQQLPAPWHMGAEGTAGGAHVSTVEFGTLDEADDESMGHREIFPHAPQEEQYPPSSDDGPSFDARRLSALPEDESVAHSTAADQAADDESSESVSSPWAAWEGTPEYAADNCESTAEEERELAGLELHEPAEASSTERDGATQNHGNTNYFAAFSPADEEQDGCSSNSDEAQAASASRDVGEQDEEREELAALSLSLPRVVFEAPSAVGDRLQPADSEPEFSAPAASEFSATEQSPTDRFFNNRPTDEIMLALQDEQGQYESFETAAVGAVDAKGQAERPEELGAEDIRAEERQTDEPTETRSPMQQELAKAGSRLAAAAHLPTAMQLFGEDFEEEVVIASNADSKPRDWTSPWAAAGAFQVGASQSADATMEQQRQAAEAADYVARIQEFADSVAAAQAASGGQGVTTVDEVLSTSQPMSLAGTSLESVSSCDPQDALSPASMGSWSVDVASVDVQHEQSVHNEIEDLVSQLNFAAFSVEPYSVEEISLEPGEHRQQTAEGAVRTGDNDEIYTLHRAQPLAEENMFSDWSAAYNDDRDLLVVEEDLPLSAKVNPPPEADQPATPIAPYSQLFAKLRK